MGELVDYAGKRAVVCGCYSGMGEATTRRLLELGAEVIGLDIKRTELPVTQFVEIDLGNRVAVDTAAAQIDGDIDALFICSGLPGMTDWPPIDVVTVNFLGPRYLIETFVPQIRNGGAVVGMLRGRIAELPGVRALS